MATVQELTEKRDRLTAQRDRIAGNGSDDNASVNISPASRNARVAAAGRRRFAQMDSDLAKFSGLTREIKSLDSSLALARGRERRAAQTAVAPESVKGARFVRDWSGTWHKVARVNKTTVSVETGYSWTDRIKLDRITDVRA